MSNQNNDSQSQDSEASEQLIEVSSSSNGSHNKQSDNKLHMKVYRKMNNASDQKDVDDGMWYQGTTFDQDIN